MSLAAWTAALTAFAVPNLVFAWRRRALKDHASQRERVLTERQRERWAAAVRWVWTIGTSSFTVLWLLFDMPIGTALFWSIAILGAGLNLLIVAALLFAIVMSWRTESDREPPHGSTFP